MKDQVIFSLRRENPRGLLRGIHTLTNREPHGG
jgi:hypothetical protein